MTSGLNTNALQQHEKITAIHLSFSVEILTTNREYKDIWGNLIFVILKCFRSSNLGGPKAPENANVPTGEIIELN